MRTTFPPRWFIVIVVAVTLTTPFLQWVSPKNELIFSNEYARSTTVKLVGLHEPADTALVALWLLFLASILVLSSELNLSLSRWLSKAPTRFEVVLGGASTFVLGAQILLPLSSGQQVNIGPTPWWLLAVGGIAIPAVLRVQRDCYRVPRAPRLFLKVVFVLLAIALQIQTPYSVADPYHFSFVGNELLAVAAGELPLGGVVHTYSNLLPYLIAPVVAFSPADPIRVVLIVLLILQIGVVVAAFGAIRKTINNRTVRLVAFLLVTCNAIALHAYTPTFPVRYWLPFLSFTILSNSRFQIQEKSINKTDGARLLGFLCGILVCNNPDFGLAAGGSLILYSVMRGRTLGLQIRDWVNYFLRWLFGIIGACVLIWGLILSLGGKPLWGDLFVLPKVFSVTGFYREPMARFEPAIILVVLALCGVAYSAQWMKLRRPGYDLVTYWLTVMSGFLLFSMTYPMGRSFQSTYASLSLPGLITAILLLDRLVIHFGNQPQPASPRTKTARYSVERQLFAIVLLSLIYLGGLAVNSASPSSVTLWWMRPSTGHVVESELYSRGLSTQMLVEAVGKDGGYREVKLSAQALIWSNYLDLEFGVESVAVSSHPEITLVLQQLLIRQCAELEAWNGLAVVDQMSYDQLEREPLCAMGVSRVLLARSLSP